MSWMGMLVALFPPLAVLLVALSVVLFAAHPGLVTLGLVLFAVYGFPLLTFRVHQLFWPVREGWHDIGQKGYNPWWGSYQFQQIYNAVPWIEGLLHLFPGGYSAWLRLWGSKVGKKVYWTPQVVVADRGLLEIGDGVVVGNRCEIYSHVMLPREGTMRLYVRRVRIGAGAVVSAHVGLTPGSVVEPGTFVRIESRVFPDEVVSETARPHHVHYVRVSPRAPAGPREPASAAQVPSS